MLYSHELAIPSTPYRLLRGGLVSSPGSASKPAALGRVT